MPYMNTNLIFGATLEPYMNINLFSGANPEPCHIPHIVSYMNTNLISAATLESLHNKSGATPDHLSYTPEPLQSTSYTSRDVIHEHKLDFWSNSEVIYKHKLVFRSKSDALHIPHIVSYMNTNLISGTTLKPLHSKFGATPEHLPYIPHCVKYEYKLDFRSNWSHSITLIIYPT